MVYTPRIIRMKISGKEKWVAVFGAGYNGGVNPDVGSAVFIMDIENEGKLLKVIDIEVGQMYSIIMFLVFLKIILKKNLC